MGEHVSTLRRSNAKVIFLLSLSSDMEYVMPGVREHGLLTAGFALFTIVATKDWSKPPFTAPGLIYASPGKSAAAGHSHPDPNTVYLSAPLWSTVQRPKLSCGPVRHHVDSYTRHA
jgi:hypothetical protein